MQIPGWVLAHWRILSTWYCMSVPVTSGFFFFFFLGGGTFFWVVLCQPVCLLPAWFCFVAPSHDHVFIVYNDLPYRNTWLRWKTQVMWMMPLWTTFSTWFLRFWCTTRFTWTCWTRCGKTGIPKPPLWATSFWTLWVFISMFYLCPIALVICVDEGLFFSIFIVNLIYRSSF